MTTTLPELAGVATYADAARIGFSVDENVRRLLRFHWVERRLMGILIAHLTSEPVWEVKCALALHQWQSAEHVDALRRRVMEMRNPTPRLDAIPQDDPSAAALDEFLEQVDSAQDTGDLLAGVYRVLYPALADAYREHVARTNPLVDHPTRRLLGFALLDVSGAIDWGEAAVQSVLSKTASKSESKSKREPKSASKSESKSESRSESKADAQASAH